MPSYSFNELFFNYLSPNRRYLELDADAAFFYTELEPAGDIGSKLILTDSFKSRFILWHEGCCVNTSKEQPRIIMEKGDCSPAATKSSLRTIKSFHRKQL